MQDRRRRGRICGEKSQFGYRYLIEFEERVIYGRGALVQSEKYWGKGLKSEVCWSSSEGRVKDLSVWGETF